MKQVFLELEDGSRFPGISFGFEQSVAGEVVFNTGMVGYPETFTDPSYKGQILVLTYPLIGNYGVPAHKKIDGIEKNFESDKIQITALIVSEQSENHNHWNSDKSLKDWLIENKIPAICGIDTRALTKKLRNHGVLLGRIVFEKDIDFKDPNKENLVSQVSTKNKVVYGSGKIRILVVDTGVKNNIIRCLLKRGVTVIRVPWDYNFFDEEFDGLFLTNGPGDPKMCDATIENVRKAINLEKPIFGICLGNQILALAADADTYKLKFGHRSQNQPCIQVGTKKCYITSQNHGFAVKPESLPEGWVSWFVNVNDNTNEGIRHSKKPFMSVQFHPEGTPGPFDTEFLFDEFIKLVNGYKHEK